MRSWVFLVLAALFALAFFFHRSNNDRPRAGDTVKPVLMGGLAWTAGESGTVVVRLEARNQDGSAARLLGFAGVPGDADPVARIVFYQGTEAQSPIEVRLSHRC